MKPDAPFTDPYAVHVANGNSSATAVWSRPSDDLFLITVRDGTLDAKQVHFGTETTENRMREAAREAIAGDGRASRVSFRNPIIAEFLYWGDPAAMGRAVIRAEAAGGAAAQAISDMFCHVDREAWNLTCLNRLNAASYDAFASEWPYGRRLKEIYTRHAWLARHVVPEEAVAAAGGPQAFLKGSPDEAVAAILTGAPGAPDAFASGRWPITAAALRCLAGYAGEQENQPREVSAIRLRMGFTGSLGEPTREAVAVMSALPPSWLPAKADLDFVTIAQCLSKTAAYGICDGPEDLLPLLAGTRGDLKNAFAPKIFLHPWHVPVNDFAAAMLDLVDYLDTWRRDFGWLAHGHVAATATVIGHEATTAAPQARPPAKLAADMHAFLFGGRALRCLLKASATWHRHERAIRHRISGGPCGDASWPALTETFAASNGITVVPLTDECMLDDEGNPETCEDGSEGLSHCIGGFSDDCRDGRIHVYSIRRPRTGGFTRLSTLAIEVDGDGEISEDEHRGHGNGKPLEEALAAAREFFEAAAAGTVAVNPEAIPSGRMQAVVPATPEPAAALQGWRPLLRGGVREMSPEEAIEAFARYRERLAASMPCREAGKAAA